MFHKMPQISLVQGWKEPALERTVGLVGSSKWALKRAGGKGTELPEK